MIMRSFNKEKYLLYLLGGIFVFQAAIFGAGLFFCARNGGLKTCPSIGTRYEQTFNVMIATTLALLTGSAVAGANQKRKTLSDPDEPLGQRPLQEQVEPLEQASSQASEPEEGKDSPKPPGKR